MVVLWISLLTSLICITSAFISLEPNGITISHKINAPFGIDTTSLITTELNGANVQSLLESVFHSGPVFQMYTVPQAGNTIGATFETVATANIEKTTVEAVHLLKASICGLMEASANLICRFSHAIDKEFSNTMSADTTEAMPRCTYLTSLTQEQLTTVNIECKATGAVTMADTYSSTAVASSFVSASFESGVAKMRDIPTYTPTALGNTASQDQFVTGSWNSFTTEEPSLIICTASVQHTNSFITSSVDIDDFRHVYGQHFDSHPTFDAPQLLFKRVMQGTHMTRLYTGIGSGTESRISGRIQAASVPVKGIRTLDIAGTTQTSLDTGATFLSAPLSMNGETVLVSVSAGYKSSSNHLPIVFKLKWGSLVLATHTVSIGALSEDCVINFEWVGSLVGDETLTVYGKGTNALTGPEANYFLWNNYMTLLISD